MADVYQTTTRWTPGPSSNGMCQEAVETTAFGLYLSPCKMSDVLQASCGEMFMVESPFVFLFFLEKQHPLPHFFFLIFGGKPTCTIKQVHELADMAYLGKAR